MFMNPSLQVNTETASSAHTALDQYATHELVETFVSDQQYAAIAVMNASSAIAQAVDASAQRLTRGGRLIYAGAGTSGRLGVLDAVELFPTFSWTRDRAPALLAGGSSAMFLAVEGAEDNREQAIVDLMALEPNETDVVFAIAASGYTPFAVAVIEAAKPLGCLTIGMANNPGSTLLQTAELSIVLDTGPEVISGSTRLKAGTAQKIALNSFSSAVMVKLHKVYGNLMVDLRATNAKLYRRALRLTMMASGANESQAEEALLACGYRVKVAIVMLKCQLAAGQAEAWLDAKAGDLRAALGEGFFREGK